METQQPCFSQPGPSRLLRTLPGRAGATDLLTRGSGSLSVDNMVVELTLLEANFVHPPPPFMETFRKYLKDLGSMWIAGILIQVLFNNLLPV